MADDPKPDPMPSTIPALEKRIAQLEERLSKMVDDDDLEGRVAETMNELIAKLKEELKGKVEEKKEEKPKTKQSHSFWW